jgi:predicted PurR-regulated permease PerM
MAYPSRTHDPSDRHYRLLIGTAAFVIIAAGIREAAEVLNSILLAMLLTVTVVPAFDALRRRGVAKGLAVLLTSLAPGSSRYSPSTRSGPRRCRNRSKT